MRVIDEFRRDEQRVLDRLVDGELGLHERRELLAALDDEPGAWRRCALAFLESQSWRWQMARMASEPILAQLTAPRKNLAGRRAFWGGFLAIAASLIVAFAVGTRFPAPGPVMEQVATNDSAPGETPAHTVARPDAEPPFDNPVEATDDVSDVPWQTLTLTPVGGNGSQDPIEVRVVGNGAGQSLTEQSPLPSYLTGSFEQDGWEVNRRLKLLPFALTDGRELVVPIEEFDLHRPDVVQF